MSDAPTTDLDLPEAAYAAATEAIEAYNLVASSDAYDMASDALRAGLPIAMAAELRRITQDGTGWAIADHLHALADELDGGTA